MTISDEKGSTVEDNSIDYKDISLAETESHTSLDAISTADFERFLDMMVVERLDVFLVAEGGHSTDVTHSFSDHLACFFEQYV